MFLQLFSVRFRSVKLFMSVPNCLKRCVKPKRSYCFRKVHYRRFRLAIGFSRLLHTFKKFARFWQQSWDEYSEHGHYEAGAKRFICIQEYPLLSEVERPLGF